MSDLPAVNMPKYATVPNGGVAKLGDGASTVGATALGVDGAAADAKACYTAGAYGGMVECVSFTTDDTAAVNARLYILDGATVKPVGIINVPINSGNAASVKNVDGLASIEGLPVNASFKKYILSLIHI